MWWKQPSHPAQTECNRGPIALFAIKTLQLTLQGVHFFNIWVKLFLDTLFLLISFHITDEEQLIYLMKVRSYLQDTSSFARCQRLGCERLVTSITVPQCCASANQLFLNFLFLFDSKMTLDCRNTERAFLKRGWRVKSFKVGRKMPGDRDQ